MIIAIGFAAGTLGESFNALSRVGLTTTHKERTKMKAKIAYIHNSNPAEDFMFTHDFDSMDDCRKFINTLNSNISDARLEFVATVTPSKSISDLFKRGKHEVS